MATPVIDYRPHDRRLSRLALAALLWNAVVLPLGLVGGVYLILAGVSRGGPVPRRPLLTVLAWLLLTVPWLAGAILSTAAIVRLRRAGGARGGAALAWVAFGLSALVVAVPAVTVILALTGVIQ